MNKTYQSYMLLFLVFLSAFFFDQMTKEDMQTSMIVWQDPANTDLYRGARTDIYSIGSPDRVSPEKNPFFINLAWQYSRNKGAAFSMFSELHDNFRVPFFFLINLVAASVIAFYLYVSSVNQSMFRYGLVMILAGAMGNFVDRLRHGYVIDFIAVEWDILGWRHDFAIFNVADVCINIGVACLLVDALFLQKAPETKKA